MVFTVAVALVALSAMLPSTVLRAQGPRYLLNVSAADLAGVLADHRLEVDDDLRTQNLFRVEDLLSRTIEGLVAEMRADVRVIGFELDGRHVVAETSAFRVNQSTAAILESLRRSSPVPYYGATVPSAYATQPAAGIIRLSTALRYGAGDVVVAVIDTGVDPNHPVLRGSLLPGYDFTRNLDGQASELLDIDQSTAAILEQSTAAILEGARALVLNQSTAAILEQSTAAILETAELPAAFGHGTMVAGLVHLVAPTARIMPLKAFGGEGSATVFDIVRAIYYAADHGARVINMSFSMTERSREIERALGYAHSRGVLMVSSVGNAGRLTSVFPASSSKVLGVASTTNEDKRSGFSNYGSDSVTLAAPGEGLITTYPGGHYAAAWGTSFSAGLVSGGAALLSRAALDEQSAYADADEAESALRHARRLTNDLGKGRLDMVKAIDARLSPDD
jgi:hypothetical protein